MAHGEKLVLVSATAGTAANTGYQPNGTTFVTGAAGLVGIWCLEVKGPIAVGQTTANAYCDGVAAFEFMNTADNVVQTERFQFTQQKTSGPPTCSPILFGGDLKRIEYRIHVNEVAATSTFTPVAANNTRYAIKLVQLGSGLAGDYEAQINPTNDVLERDGQVYYYEMTSDATATQTEISDNLMNQINADTTNPFVATGGGGITLIVTAQNMETDFQCIDVVGNGAWSVAKAVGTDGEGNGRQVVGAEKANEGYGGYHNRIWLPSAPERFALAATDYDSIVYTFDHGPGSYNARNTNQINDAAKYGDYVVEHYVTEEMGAGSNIDEVIGSMTVGTNHIITDFGY